MRINFPWVAKRADDVKIEKKYRIAKDGLGKFHTQEWAGFGWEDMFLDDGFDTKAEAQAQIDSYVESGRRWALAKQRIPC